MSARPAPRALVAALFTLLACCAGPASASAAELTVTGDCIAVTRFSELGPVHSTVSGLEPGKKYFVSVESAPGAGPSNMVAVKEVTANDAGGVSVTNAGGPAGGHASLTVKVRPSQVYTVALAERTLPVCGWVQPALTTPECLEREPATGYLAPFSVTLTDGGWWTPYNVMVESNPGATHLGHFVYGATVTNADGFFTHTPSIDPSYVVPTVTSVHVKVRPQYSWSQVVTVEREVPICAASDSTPPVVTPIVEGDEGHDGWYRSDVTVSWEARDGESPIDSTSGCDTVTVDADTAGRTFTCTATSAGGTTTSEPVTIKRDATAPAITATRTEPNAAGWNDGDVTVTFACSDEGGSGVASCTDPKTLSADGAGQVAHGEAVDAAGNTALVRVEDIDIDTTAPSVDLTGGGTYTIADTVTIGCTVTDSLSGVASDTCADVAGTRPAWEYALGDTAVSATATDAAGNDGTGSATVTVNATAASLCTLTQRWVDKRAVADALCVKLEHGDLGSYRNHLAAQAGKSVSAENVATLTRLAAAL